jgi:cytochrome c553
MPEPHPKSHKEGNLGVLAATAVFGLLFFSLIVGLIVLPTAQASNANLDAWTAICRAVGLQPGVPAQPQPPVSATAQPVSQVRWSPATLRVLNAADPRPGATVAAAVCINCHGQEGFSLSADFPSLSGQSAEAIYKQLADYRSGARVHPQMTGVARNLTEPQVAQVAAHFASYGLSDQLGRRYPLPDPQIARLTQRGDPARGIPPCESCHARGVGGPPEAPILTGQHAAYLERQLHLYASGQRRNDVYQRMRNIAPRLSQDEMRRLAAYYQGVN